MRRALVALLVVSAVLTAVWVGRKREFGEEWGWR
jgi:hypothetical protein